MRRTLRSGCRRSIAARVLETAAGTGIVTRALLRALPGSVAIVATDLNQPMVDHAAAQVSSSRVTWQKADAQSLPFPDGAFDAVVCQFGVMFFPDRRQAYREARRVLKPGGRFIFNVWDKLEYNEFAALVTAAAIESFPTIRRFSWQERRTGITTRTRSSPTFAAPASSMSRWKP